MSNERSRFKRDELRVNFFDVGVPLGGHDPTK